MNRADVARHADAACVEVLADGTRVEIRPIRADDAEELQRAFERLSPESRYQRFFAPLASLEASTLRFLTNVDGEDHVALVAVTDSHDMKREVGLGVARFIRVDGEPTVAEGAITVIDDAQNKGLGRLLLAKMADAARARGIRTVRAEVLASNAKMRRLLEKAGAVVRSNDGDTVAVDVPIANAARG